MAIANKCNKSFIPPFPPPLLIWNDLQDNIGRIPLYKKFQNDATMDSLLFCIMNGSIIVDVDAIVDVVDDDDVVDVVDDDDEWYLELWLVFF